MPTKNIEILRKGGVGVLLTDTLYGVVGRALDKKVVARIYNIKGRDENKPFIILVSSMQELALFGVSLSPKEKRAINNYWPGPVSIILPCKKKKFTYLHRGEHTLAFRLPAKKSLMALLKKVGPLVAPSANPQGLPPAKTITEAREYFGDTVDFYMYGGKPRKKPSKIIKIDNERVTIIRG